eukprot:CAMPEP_0201508442 /NCGR_PEP_ID=MMETSP0161_2-20130828/1817_1 /ASSEMBLY_ACC=CAM_ASM_000251 /TAXON_ID=180227 /ORGANISM="Neoparamoeba aestuarina, Strain SoJaBio B1-5/56/2" /LENGTH=355 /DNA_ID=CAMNT_0047903115 /DNA_START=141 /DNA_END=1205 /DNA_ORIENTATION=-
MSNPYSLDTSDPSKAPIPYQTPSAPEVEIEVDDSYPIKPPNPYTDDLDPSAPPDDVDISPQAGLLNGLPKEARVLGMVEEKKNPHKWNAFDSDNTKEGKSCRICFDDGNTKDFIAPCQCAGSTKWVHRSCLEQWQSTSLFAYQRCPNCLFEYRLDPSHSPSYRDALWRFRGYLFLDFLGFLFVWQLIVFAIFGILVGVDFQANIFWQMYGWAMLIFLAGLGLVGSCLGCFKFLCLKDDEEDHYAGAGSGSRCPVFVCYGGHCDCDCCIYCCSGDCGGGCDCNNCNGDCKEAFLVIIVLLALIGIFVLFYVGSSYMARRYNQRSKKLLFLSSAKEERVMDLSKISAEERDDLEVLK